MPQTRDIPAKRAQARALTRLLRSHPGIQPGQRELGDSPAIATNAAATAVSANSRSKSPVAIPRRMPVKTPGML